MAKGSKGKIVQIIGTVVDVEFPASDLPGERAWPTQPFPTKPPPLVPQRLTEDDLYSPTPEHYAACRDRLRELLEGRAR